MGKENELINAVKEGNGQFVRKALHKYRRSNKKPTGKKATINVADPEGFTSLHHAALLGDVEVIMAIIEMDGDVNAKDKKGMTPLHLAAWAGKEAGVRALVENRALPNLPSTSGETPLHLAAQHGYAACAKVLLGSHADGTFRNGGLETPLDLACQYGHTSVVKQLLQNDAVLVSLTSPSTDPRYKSPLQLAAKTGHDDIVHLLLLAGVNVNECRAEGTALHLASLYGKRDVVKTLIQNGVNVGLRNKDGLMALDVVTQFTASRAGLEIKQMLREAAGERLVYARAVSDYNNKYDETCLSFKSGDSVAVIEQNEDGRWKGYVVNRENEKLGYFPAMAVHVLTPASSIKTMSISSMASSTSVESTSRGVQTPNGSPERKVNANHDAGSPATTPVGIVPIGNFEVLTLAQGEQEFNHPPKQTAAGSFPPRMSSFKQKQASKSPIKSPRCSRLPSHKGPAPPPPVRSQSNESEPRRPEELPGSMSQRSISERQYHIPHRQDPPVPHRSISQEEPPQLYNRSHTVNAQMVGRHSVKQKQPEPSSNQDFRNRTHSAGSAQNNFTRALKMAIGNRAEQEKQNAVRQNSSTGSMEKTRNYAEIEFSPGNSPVVKSPVFISEEDSKGNYAGIYIDETDEVPNEQKTVINNVDVKNSVNKNMHYQEFKLNNQPTNINGYHDDNRHVRRRLLSDEETTTTNNRQEPGVYEDMEIRQNSISVKSTTTWKSGYEDMTSHFSRPDFELPPPELPLKGQGPQLPLKRSNTAPSYRHSDKKTPTIVPTSSSKSRERPVYENQQLKIQVNRTSSTGSGRSSPSDHRVSRTDQEVFDWLTELKLTCYFDVFKTHGFDMISIQAITPEDLSYLEVHKMGHRKKMLVEIAKLSYSEQRLPNHKPRDVGSWLGLLNLRQYEPNFVEGGFDDMDFIKDLDKNDLEMIDIKKRGHQKKLLLAVQRLNDLELTAVLDIAVMESPIKRAQSFTNRSRDQQQVNSSVFQFPLPATNTSLRNEQAEEFEEDMSATVASSRSPPPATAAKPGKAPVAVPSPKPKMNGEAPQPARKPSVGPGVKPKPKPAAKPPASPAAKVVSGEVQGSQEEIVQSSKSRDFFKQQEKKVTDDSPNNTIDRRGSQASIERRSSQSSSGSISPTGTINKKKPAIPPPAPKPKPHVEEKPTPAPPVALKKAPPPAPPKRGDSIPVEHAPPPPQPATVVPPTTLPEVEQPAPAPPSQQPSPPPTVSPTLPPPPPPEEPQELAKVCFSPPMPAFIPPPPPTESPEPNVEDENLPPPPADILDESQGDTNKNEDKEIEKAFDETDDLLSDIMADLNDFSSQIDNMF